MRIAVLEDDIILRELIQATLERAGHAHQGYGQAGPLLHDLHRETFDLVLVDWHLPGMDGPDAVRAMRKAAPATMPIVFLTRRNTGQYVVDGLDWGTDEYMIKPVRMGELLRASTPCCAGPTRPPCPARWTSAATASTRKAAACGWMACRWR